MFVVCLCCLWLVLFVAQRQRCWRLIGCCCLCCLVWCVNWLSLLVLFVVVSSCVVVDWYCFVGCRVIVACCLCLLLFVVLMVYDVVARVLLIVVWCCCYVFAWLFVRYCSLWLFVVMDCCCSLMVALVVYVFFGVVCR